MNFKPTKFKIIFSLIIAIIVDLFSAWTVICVDTVYGGGCSITSNALHPTILAISVASFIIVYLVWSLMEKK